MADYMRADLTIGGAVTEEQLEGIFEKIDDEGANISLGSQDDSYASRDEAIAHINEYRSLVVYDIQASNGRFDVLEAYLKEQGIPFIRQTEASGTYNAEYVFFDGVNKHDIEVDSEHESVVYVTNLKPLMKLLGENKKEEAKNLLESLLPIEPSLPDLVIQA